MPWKINLSQGILNLNPEIGSATLSLSRRQLPKCTADFQFVFIYHFGFLTFRNICIRPPASRLISKRLSCAGGNWYPGYYYNVFHTLHPWLQRCRYHGAFTLLHQSGFINFVGPVQQIFNPILYITSAF